MKGTAIRRVLLLLAALGGVPSCAAPIPTAIKSCPCADGNVCCSSGVCARSVDACGAAALELAREAEGVWTGYLENFTFPSGSDALKVVLSAQAPQPVAELTMGAEGGAVAPDGRGTDAGLWSDGDSLGGQTKEGFPYRAADLRWESRRLKFTVHFADSWAEQCASYTPFTLEGYTFYCPRQGGYSPDEGCQVTVGDTSLPVDCHLLDRCFDSHCDCDESRCVVKDTAATLDIALDQGVGDGSVVFKGVPTNVRLVRHDR